MKVLICAVRDSAVEAFMQPFFCLAQGQAVRSFTDNVNNAKEASPLYMHPDDFELFELGWFGDGDAHFELHAKPVRLVRGADVKVRDQRGGVFAPGVDPLPGFRQ